MSGIVFLGTRDLAAIRDYYVSRVGMTVWLEQAECAVFKHDNFLLGFCQRKEIDTSGIITFFYPTPAEVDVMFERFRQEATGAPKENPAYRIYHFFVEDPEGRSVEFQAFLHPVKPYAGAEAVLSGRRSIRRFKKDAVEEDLIRRIVESCRYAPSSRNAQPTYFIVVRDKKALQALAALRGSSSAPISRAPVAVAVCSDPHVSKRHVQDGCISAYHLTLAAHTHGLGTCWIAAMDRPEVKAILAIPESHHVATVTPLGYPAETPETPQRKPLNEVLRYL